MDQDSDRMLDHWLSGTVPPPDEYDDGYAVAFEDVAVDPGPVLLDGTPLTDFAAPWITAVTVATAPILARAGLDANATLDEIIADPALCEELVNAATAAVQAGSGFAPYQPLYEGLDIELPEFDRSMRMMPLGRTRDGEPCYPRVPGFPDLHPRCPPPPDPAEVEPWDCLGDPDISAALTRLESFRHFGRLPALYQGLDYVTALRDSINEGAAARSAVYSCENIFPGAFAAYGRGDKLVHLQKPLATLSPLSDLLSLLNGPRDFRAGIVLHEHVHRVDNITFDRDNQKPFGTLTSCPGTEYRAAYLQGKYYGANDCTADMIGRVYARSVPACEPRPSSTQQALSAFQDLFRCTTSQLTLIQVLGALGAAIVDPINFVIALTAVVPSNIMVLFAWVVLL
jgi:hypothetical protein